MYERLRPEHWAALVNGLVVLCVLPLVFRAPTLLLGMIPYALVAAWRTWAHARRWESGDRGWLGIAEAGVCGFAAFLIGGLLHTTHSLAQAIPYFTFYGFFAFIGALPVGLLLFLTARLVLWLTRGQPTVT